MTSSGNRASELLREKILRAAIPFVAQWKTVTTAQLAGAAGIDEATLLGVFADKDAALTAALQTLMMRALDPTQVVRELRSIPVDQPLAERLVQAIDALDTYHHRILTVIGPLDASGTQERQPTRDRESDTGDAGRQDFRVAVRQDVIHGAVVRLLEPDRPHLRLGAPDLADALLGLYAGRKRSPHPESSLSSAEQLVDLFLHGALTDPDPVREWDRPR